MESDWHVAALVAIVPMFSGLATWVLLSDRRITRHDEKIKRLEADVRACLKRQTDSLEGIHH